MAHHETPHVEVLLSACRLALGISDGTALTLTSDEWDAAVTAALHHGLIWPLEKLSRQVDGLPNQVRARIRAGLQAQAAQNLQLVDALLEIVGVFRSRGITSAVLKGPAVAQITTGKIATREFTDLDILVHFEDVEIAIFALSSLGYRQMDEYQCAFRSIRRRKHITFVNDVDRVFVELHWALNPADSRFPLESTGIWTRLQTICIHRESLRTLGMEDTLLALCVHGSIHAWESLKWIFDIAQLMNDRAVAIDWNALFLRSQTAGCSRSLLVGIRLAAELFRVKEPDLLNGLKDACATEIVGRFRDSILGKRILSTVETTTFRIQVHDRLWDRMVLASVLLVRRLPPTIADPTAAGPLWVVIRPVRLLQSYGLGWLRGAIMAR